ncbi:hypothetical protein F2P79_012761 [Pimephales promelas]|nr:hypothetical protein F2P79_012761 [Pimephales promelas]
MWNKTPNTLCPVPLPPVTVSGSAKGISVGPTSDATRVSFGAAEEDAMSVAASQVTKSYRAAGQAAASLHAMATLQVYQAQMLRDKHEGRTNPGLFDELRATTDLALQATEVTTCSLGLVMSRAMVQERHLWLNLADMKDAEWSQLLDTPMSQAGLFGGAVEDFAQLFSTAQKQTEAIKHILPHRPAAAST